jgi:hypothetical protein
VAGYQGGHQLGVGFVSLLLLLQDVRHRAKGVVLQGGYQTESQRYLSLSSVTLRRQSYTSAIINQLCIVSHQKEGRHSEAAACSGAAVSAIASVQEEGHQL